MTLQELCHPERSEESQNSVILPLLYKDLFSIYDVETGLGNLSELATLEVFGFDNAVLSQPKRYNLRLYYA